jgi:hypothetical protein
MNDFYSDLEAALFRGYRLPLVLRDVVKEAAAMDCSASVVIDGESNIDCRENDCFICSCKRLNSQLLELAGT